METLGSILEKGRINRGISIEELAESSRISIRFLKAAESDNWEEINGDIYIKGVLRSYAKFLSLDESDLISRYEKLNLVPRDESPVMISIPLDQSLHRRKLVRKVIAILLIALFLLIYLIFSGKQEDQALDLKVSESVEVSDADKENPIIEDQHVNDESLKTEIKAGSNVERDFSATDQPLNSTAKVSENENRFSLNKVGTELQTESEKRKQAVKVESPSKKKDSNTEGYNFVTVKGNDITWVNITLDDSTQSDFILKAGESKSFKVKERFKISIGNLRSTKVSINGDEYQLPAGNRNVLLNETINIPQNIKTDLDL